MDETNDQTSRRTYLKTLGAIGAASTVGLAGCSENAAGATGTIATAVTDQPGDIADFESCIVTIQGIWLKPASDDETGTDETETAGENGVVEQDEDDIDQSDAREYHEFDEPQDADLVKLQDGKTDLIDERAVTAQSYEFLQLDVSDVAGTLSDGSDATVDTPGNAPLQFKHPFEVRADQRTTFVADFTPIKRGQTNRYLLRPVATRTEVRYEDRETKSETETTAQS